MITLKIFGTMRLECGEKEWQAESANSVLELIEAFSRQNEKASIKELKQCFVYVNGVSIDKLKMFKTPLKDGDEVSLLSPVSGG